MNNQDRLELGLLRNRQVRLGEELDALSQRIRKLEDRLEQQAAAASPVLPPPLPPVIDQPQAEMEPQEGVVYIEQEQFEAEEAPGSVGADVVPQSQEVAATGTGAEAVVSQSRDESLPGVGRGFAPPLEPAASQSASAPESFELRLGTYWFVRVGVVLLLTALAFLGNYAYQNFIFKMAAGGKVALMYMASGLLLGAGAWLQRKSGIDKLRNYAQVLFAGGLAAVYFTTYGAHHIERLRVIESPVLDGTLLLAWAAFIVWLADRKKSELLALFALGLAYYTSTITRTGAFTLYSNLLLTAASVFFLCRNRWVVLSVISLPATYGGYAFWRFYAPVGWRFPGPDEGLVFSAAFLGAYWVVFSFAVFLSKHDRLRGGNRALFLTSNNAAALGLFLLTMAQLHTGGLWRVFLGFGSALLVLAYLSRVLLADDPLVKQSYLTQGLALVTAGFIAKYSGMNRALLLSVESVVLFALGSRLPSTILRVGGWICGLMAVGWAMDSLNGLEHGTLYMGLGVAIAMLVNAVFADRRGAAGELSLRGEVAFFTVLLLVMLGSVCWTHVERENLGGVLAGTALVLTFSVYLLRIREIPILSQGLLVFGLVVWLGNVVARAGAPWEGWSQPALLLAVTTALLHWWQRERIIELERAARYFFQVICAGGIVSVLFTWTMPELRVSGNEEHYAAVLAATAMALTGYAAATRSGVLAIVSQVLLIPAGLLFVDQMAKKAAPWQSLLVVPLGFMLLAAGTIAWLRDREELAENVRVTIRNAARCYAWIGLGLLALLVAAYVPARNCPWAYALLSLAPFLLAGPRSRELLPYSLALIVCAVAAYVAPMRDDVWTHVPNLLFILVLLAMQRAARRLPGRYDLPEPLQRAMVILGGLCLWLFVSRYVQQNVTGFLLTVTWSILALVLFGLGMALRERPYRWLGLVVLGASLGRVVLLDVWKLHTIYRILSFMALGLVLLVLGYIYNRYQEKIREWL